MEETLSPDSPELENTLERPALAEPIAVGWKSIFGIGFLVVIADLLMWGQTLGLGFALFSVAVAITLLLFRREHWKHSGTWIWFLCLLVVSGLNVVRIDSIGVGLFCLMVLFGIGHLGAPLIVPFWLKLIEGLGAVFRLPVSLNRFSWQSAGGQSFKLSGLPDQAGRLVRVVLPAILLCIPFIILFMSGNAVMRSASGEKFTLFMDWLNSLNPPTSGRYFFWGMMALFSLAIVIKIKPMTLGVTLKESFSKPKDLSIVVWQTRICLLMVNALFLVVNWTDLAFLWGNKALPEGVSNSQFVHEGTWSLVGCVMLAAAVLSFFFFQDREVCNAKGVRLLGHLWVIQNLFLVAGVIFRVQLYVETWQLSLLRVYLIAGLLLIGLGFILLSIRIQFNMSFSWLVSANVIAAFVMLLGIHAWDEHRYVAEYNVAAVTEFADGIVDLAYLKKLGPSAIPSIEQVASDPERFGSRVAKNAKLLLEEISTKQKSEDWRSFRLGELFVSRAKAK